MRKFFVTAACLCMLAIPVYGTNVDAASVPWDSTIELKGTVNIGSTVTIPARVYHAGTPEGDYEDYYYTGGVGYYQMNVTAGQSYYIDSKECGVRLYDSEGNNAYSDGYYESVISDHYYAVKNETIYVRFTNDEDEAEQATIRAGQTFTGNVTKADGWGDNVYYYTPSLSGQYTFRVSSSDDEADPSLSIGMMKRDYFSSLKSKDLKWTHSFGYEEVTANLQAGTCYAIKVDNDMYMYGSEIYNSYTLSLTQKPAVSVAGVKAKKAVSKKAKKAVITWKKASGVDGYQVTYSLKKNFKKAKSVNVSAKKAKVTLKKLKRGKKYFVKVRAYRNVEGARYYGGYSKTLKVTVR